VAVLFQTPAAATYTPGSLGIPAAPFGHTYPKKTSGTNLYSQQYQAEHKVRGHAPSSVAHCSALRSAPRHTAAYCGLHWRNCFIVKGPFALHTRL